MKTCDFGVLIGRFQPFHFGHLSLVKDALNKTGKLVILIGSSNRPRLERNPFTFDERAEMISLSIAEELGSNAVEKVSIEPIPDRLYDYPAWLQEVQHVLVRHADDTVLPSTGLFGHVRDHTSYYLKDFPDWTSMIAAEAGSGNIEATSIRKAYFGPHSPEMVNYLKNVTPETVVDWLIRFRGTEAYTDILADMAANAEYKQAWGSGPHSTADSVVLCSGRVLMVRRSVRPLIGKLALPGGFLNLPETLYQCATRELAEETLIDLSEAPHASVEMRAKLTRERLRSAYKGRDVFDDPHRSERARIITTAHVFDLGQGTPPSVVGADDAASAEWTPLTSIRAREVFDDHAFIVPRMLKLIDRGLIH